MSSLVRLFDENYNQRKRIKPRSTDVTFTILVLQSHMTLVVCFKRKVFFFTSHMPMHARTHTRMTPCCSIAVINREGLMSYVISKFTDNGLTDVKSL